jgi:hypothetical protein
VSVSAETVCGLKAIWAVYLWAKESRFPGADRSWMKTCPNVRATTWEDQALVLTGPFRGQVAEAGHSQSVSKTPIDGSLNEIGCEEGKRDCLVDLSDAAALAAYDGSVLDWGSVMSSMMAGCSPANTSPLNATSPM